MDWPLGIQFLLRNQNPLKFIFSYKYRAQYCYVRRASERARSINKIIISVACYIYIYSVLYAQRENEKNAYIILVVFFQKLTGRPIKLYRSQRNVKHSVYTAYNVLIFNNQNHFFSS